MGLTKDQFYETFPRYPNWEVQADLQWARLEAAAAWFDQPIPTGAALVWPIERAPAEFRQCFSEEIPGWWFLAVIHKSMANYPWVHAASRKWAWLPNDWSLVIWGSS